MKKFRFTNRTNIRLGFEVECYVRQRESDTFESKIKAISQNICLDDDCSIEPPEMGEYATYELQTPVLPPAEAMKMLERIFDVVGKHGGTNDSCGLHVNISSKDKKRMKRFNPLPFITNPIWNKLLRDFRRLTNDFCLPVYNPNVDLVSVLESGWCENATDRYGCCFDKDSCVNLANWDGGQSNYSRLEVRGMGNTRYHLRFLAVSKYVKRIIKLFILCCDKSPTFRV